MPSSSPRARRQAPGRPLTPEVQGVLRSFRVVFNAVRKHFRSTQEQARASHAQVWALSIVRDRPGIGVSELAAVLDVHQSTASNLVRRLVADGLVKLERSAGDRRAVHLGTTAAGVRLLKKAPGPFAGVLPDALAALDSATLRRLDRDLARLAGILGPDGDGARVLMSQRRRPR